MMDEEKLPEHVEISGGAPVCKHCGGEVGEDGYAMALGGLVEDGDGDEDDMAVKPNVDGDPKRLEMTSFADSLKKRVAR